MAWRSGVTPGRRAGRAAAVIGLYLGLTLAPLAVAALAPASGPLSFGGAVGVAAGLLAFGLLAAESVLVSRLRWAAAPFGTDALMHFHRLMGVAAVGFVVAHPLLLLGPRATAMALVGWRGGADRGAGWAALLLVVVVVVTSIGRRRLRLSYEAWRAIHAAGAVLIVATSLLHAVLLGRRTASPLVAATLGAYAVAFVALVARRTLVRPLLLARRPWVVVENRDEGASTRTLVLRPSAGAGFPFAPGHFVWLVTGRRPWRGQEHPLTIASSAERPPGGPIELAVKDLGDWSGGVVPRLAPGTRVWVDGPYGVFTPDETPCDGLLLIAGGIGITPMRSILLTMRDRGDRRPVVLVYAARSWSRVVFRAEIERLQAVLDLRVVWVFEEPDAGWAGERGFVTAAILRRHLPRNVARWECFVCGPPPMLDAMERVLPAVGVATRRIHTERFEVV
jgi:predicted ferric reductase